MGEPENWDDETPQAEPAPAPGASKPLSLNPNAPSFTFNPGAASFSPGGAKPAAPAPAPAPVPAAAPAPVPAAAAPPAPAPEPSPPAAAPVPAAPAPVKEKAPPPPAPKEEKAPSKKVDAVTKKVEEVALADNAPPGEDDYDDNREHLNLVFIGHVDAGKSTIGGQILFLTGAVDDRTIQKYEKEAKDKNRESWYMAYIMDTNEEERAKGKTVEVGRAHFETEKKRYTVLDAPGHKNYVPNMIGGAAQADVGVLVIAARKGEFETGFERGGQTREHAQLAKTLGVSKLVVLCNKMDDPSVKWDKERFDEIQTKLTPFLRSCGYNTKQDVTFVPCSGLMGYNIKDRVTKEMCPWYEGPSFFEHLDKMDPCDRDPDAPFRMPIIDKFRDMGTVLMGKTEAGAIKRGDGLMVMPNRVPVKVVSLYRDETECSACKPGENVRVRVTGIEEEDVLPGFVLCSAVRPVPAVTVLDAQLAVLELLEHKAIFTAGYTAVLHVHSVVEECEVLKLIAQIDPKTKQPIKKKCMFVKSGSIVNCRIKVEQAICVELFKDYPQLGRFTLRDEGKTIAIGKVMRLPKMTGAEAAGKAAEEHVG